MKSLVIVYDGMADRPVPELGGRTPMEVACTPAMDGLSADALIGTVLNVPAGMVPESDTANLAILSYDPRVYSKGRSPLEAVSMGLTMAPEDTALRCNLVTLTEDGPYEEKTMLDHSSGEITTEEARELIRALDAALGTKDRRFHTGVSYRHCLLWRGAPDSYPFARPHDILGRRIGSYLPGGDEGRAFLELQKKSYDILNHHPVNEARRARGQHVANSIWLWSPGKKPALPSFAEKWGKKTTVISAVDLIKGIALCAGMESIDVPGATGNLHTNYRGKAEAAADAFRHGQDMVYVHVEALDECGHQGDARGKVQSIEHIDGEILAPLCRFLREGDEPFRVLLLPDHPTPITLRTHSEEPVPFLLYDSTCHHRGVHHLTEETARRAQLYLPDGTALMGMLFAQS